MFEVGAADFKKSELLFRAFRHETLHILVIVFLWNFHKVKTGVVCRRPRRPGSNFIAIKMVSATGATTDQDEIEYNVQGKTIRLLLIPKRRRLLSLICVCSTN